jgi:hypothetical protein
MGFRGWDFGLRFDLVVKASEVDEFGYAIEQGWIELAPGRHLVRVTAKGVNRPGFSGGCFV